MPRATSAVCMFCDEVPCVCNDSRKKKKPSTPKKKPEPVVEQPVQPVKRPSAIAAMKATLADKALSSDNQETIYSAVKNDTPAPEKQKTRLPIDEDRIVEAAAIRALAPILHSDDRTRFDAIIKSDPHPDERAILWRARRQSLLAEDSKSS